MSDESSDSEADLVKVITLESGEGALLSKIKAIRGAFLIREGGVV